MFALHCILVMQNDCFCQRLSAFVHDAGVIKLGGLNAGVETELPYLVRSDCRLLVVMGRDFVSALQPVAYCTVPR
jgi:hypothetical protein